MEAGHEEDRWNHTALLAMLAFNPHRDTKVQPRPKEFADFHPQLIEKKRRARRANSGARVLSAIGGQAFIITENHSWEKVPATSSPAVPPS